jgi:hypothetical protein
LIYRLIANKRERLQIGLYEVITPFLNIKHVPQGGREVKVKRGGNGKKYDDGRRKSFCVFAKSRDRTSSIFFSKSLRGGGGGGDK